MSNFFKHFPLNDYDFFDDGSTSKIVEIFRNVSLDQIRSDSITQYTFQDIINGERPDVLSQRIYGSPNYHWTFFILNNELKKGLSAWPKSDLSLERFIAGKYDSYATGWLSPRYETHREDLSSYIVNNQGEVVKLITSFSGTSVYDTLNGLSFIPEVLYIKDTLSGSIFKIREWNSTIGQLTVHRNTLALVEVLNENDGVYVLPPKLTVDGGVSIEANISGGGKLIGARITDVGNGTPTGESRSVITVHNSPEVEAVLRVTTSAGVVTAISIVNPGVRYVKVPTVTITAPITGVNTATATVTLDNTGSIDAVVITNPGSGYNDNVRVIAKVIHESDETDLLIGRNATDSYIKSNLENSSFTIHYVNPLNSEDSRYTDTQLRIDNWIDSVFIPWARIIRPREAFYWNTRADENTGLLLPYTRDEILEDVRFSFTLFWNTTRNAPYVYIDDEGYEISAFSATANTQYKSYAEYENQLNETSRNIRVIRPDSIEEFTQEFRRLIKQ
jgi:hypothetical protein